jgi:hypothetical protein
MSGDTANDEHEPELDERLRELGAEVPAGPWHYQRSKDGEALILYDGDEPLALVYGGTDLAKYLSACAPARLFGGSR